MIFLIFLITKRRVQCIKARFSELFRVKFDLNQSNWAVSGFRTKKRGKVFGVSLVQHGVITGFKIFCTALHRWRVVHSCCDWYLKMDSNGLCI